MKQLITLCLILSSFTLFSQSNFVAGSISLPDGQSQKGLIDYREWQVNPRSIRFKDLKGKITEYTCKDLLEFRIDENNEIYKKANTSVNYEEPPYYQSASEIDYKIKLTRDTVFLLTLVKGNINLYQLIEPNHREHFFIQKNNGRIEELIYRVVFVYNHLAGGIPVVGFNGTISVGNSITGSTYLPVLFDEYNKQLANAMSDWPSLESVLNKKQLQKLVKEYNEFKGQSTYVRPRDKGSFALFGYGGMSQSNFKVAETDFFFDNIKTATQTTSPTLGLGFEFGIPRTNKKLFVGLDMSYVQNKTYITNKFKTTQNHYDIDMKGLRYKAYFKFVPFRIPAFQAYIKGGLNVSNYFTSYYDSNSEVSFTVNRRPQNVQLLKMEKYFYGAVGAQLHSFFFEARYEPGTDLNNTTGQDLKINRTSFLVGYSLPLSKKH